MLGISSLQKRVETSYDIVKSSIKSVENSVSTLKCGVDKMSQDCQEEFKALESKNTKLQESVTEVNRVVKSSKDVITEIEKSLTVMTQLEDFRKPVKTAKLTVPGEDRTSTSTSNTYAGLIGEDDEEVTFRNVESNQQSAIVIADETDEQQQSSENEDRQPVDESSQNTEGSTTPRDGEMANESPNVLEKNSNIMPKTRYTVDVERRINGTRRDKIYLIGDSIAGQVHQAALGKSTRTFVQKLKAPTIQDISKLTSQVKDAKLIIVHTGINNIRQDEPTENRVSDFVKVIKSLKEVAPESKVVVSKPIPIGDQKSDIVRNIFNASIVKELSEDSEVNVCFLDHGNLAEQAFPIKRYYRQDLVHLSPDGLDVFSTNLCRMILEVLKKSGMPDEDIQREDINNNREDSSNYYRPLFYANYRQNFSGERYSELSGNNGRNGHSNNLSGRSNDFQYRDGNRDSYSNGSTGHQTKHTRNRESYQHRYYNRGSNWRNGHRNSYPGRYNGYPYRDEYSDNSKNIGHRNTFTGNRDDYPNRDDERGYNENKGYRNMFKGNRDDYRFRDDERGHYDRNTFTGIRDGHQRRDNDRYTSDNYHSGERYSEHERRYNEKRRYDWF